MNENITRLGIDLAKNIFQAQHVKCSVLCMMNEWRLINA